MSELPQVLLMNPRDHLPAQRAFPALRAESRRCARGALRRHPDRRQPRSRLRRHGAAPGARTALRGRGRHRHGRSAAAHRALRSRKRDPRAASAAADHLGRLLPDALPGGGAERGVRRLSGAWPGRGDLAELLERPRRREPRPWRIAGLSWRRRGASCTTAARRSRAPSLAHGCRTRSSATRSSICPDLHGRRTASYQAALGCRFRCTFCGVAAMFRGETAVPRGARLEADLRLLTRLGADAIQFYDHNFFDREEDMVPMLEVLASSAALVVLCARGCADEMSEQLLGAGARESAAHGLHRCRDAQRMAAARGPQGHAARSDPRGRGAMPSPRGHAGAVLHAGAPAGPGRGDRADV